MIFFLGKREDLSRTNVDKTFLLFLCESGLYGLVELDNRIISHGTDSNRTPFCVLNAFAFFDNTFQMNFLVLAKPNELDVSLNLLAISGYVLEYWLYRFLCGVIDVSQDKVLSGYDQRSIGFVLLFELEFNGTQGTCFVLLGANADLWIVEFVNQVAGHWNEADSMCNLLVTKR